MSDFLLVVPTGWDEITAVNDLISAGSLPTQEITYPASLGAWADIDTILYNCGALPAGKTVSNARLIYTDAGYRFWVQFTDVTPL